jgi:LuxR family maltose regulon positive regulatory protein
MSLIQTKTLIPREGKRLLRRERLVNFLHENIDRQLILISAGAGYGKTSLLVDFASDAEMPICWYAPDESDRSLRDFAEYLVASIEQTFPDRLPESRLLVTQWSSNAQSEALAGVLVNEILRNIPDFFVVVIDDYHLVDDILAINLFLDAFLRYQPENCRLIIASRSIPTLTPRGMALLVANQQIAGLGPSDLQFTAAEVSDLFRQIYGQDLSPAQAEDLARDSEGWITAILLTRDPTSKRLVGGLPQVAGGRAGVYNYLANEVFERLDADRRQFLEATAVVSVMSAGLCDALLGRSDSREVLDELHERNLFITQIEREGQVWFQYHRLFREFLLAKLRARGANRELLLHLKAARYLESAGDTMEAIRHYLEAGASGDAARLIATVAPSIYDSGRYDTLMDWIQALPAAALDQAPRLWWFKSKITLQRGQAEEAIQLADRAATLFAAQGDRLGRAQALLDKSSALGQLRRVNEALAASQEALAALEGLDLDQKGLVVLAGAHRFIGVCRHLLGETEQGINELRQALEVGERAGYGANLALIHNDLGALLRVVGNLTGAQYHFDQALHICERDGNLTGMVNTLNSIGFTHHLRGEYDQALDVYSHGLRRAREIGDTRMAAFILAGMGDTYLARGEAERAIEAFEQAQVQCQHDAYLSDYLLGGIATAHLLLGNPGKALELANQAFERAQERGARQDAAMYQIILGAVCYQQGRSRRALEHLSKAVETLREARAKRDLARAQLHLAQAYYRAGDIDQALHILDELTDTLLDVGQDQFLVPEARQMVPLLEYAVTRKVGEAILARLYERVRQQAAPVGAPAAVSAGQPAEAPPLRVYALGETRVLRGDQLITAKDWGTVKARQLFFYLLTVRGQRKEQIAQVFWPDAPAAQVRSSFHITTYRLRRALHDNDALVFEDDRYQLNRRLNIWYDVWEFERLLNEADSLDRVAPTQAAERRQEAIELVRGEFCEDLPDMEWKVEEARAIERRYLAAMQRHGEYLLEMGQPQPALSLFYRVLKNDDLREDAHRGVMRALAALGDRAGALRHYQQLVDHLLKETDADPESATIDLYHRIAAGNT